MEEKRKTVIQELFEVLVKSDLTYAEADQIVTTLKHKLYASAKIK